MIADSIVALDSPGAAEFMRRDPWPLVGLALMGVGNVAYFRMLLKLQQARVDGLSAAAQWKIPILYLREANHRGWSPWLAFATPFFYAVGAAFLVFGLFHLYN